MSNNYTDIIDFDAKHVWHPYTSMTKPLPAFVVESAQGVNLTFASGETVVDGMSSWWSVIHGYNHPMLNQAVIDQTNQFAHVMFGGLTHEPAVELCRKLIKLTPDGLNKVFLADSGSVSVEVAIKMAFQFWISQGNSQKSKLVSLKNGYHGDTFAAMSVCDPENGMHHMFKEVIQQHYFVDAPKCRFDDNWNPDELNGLKALLAEHHQDIAALILEPVVQGAGGMKIYHPQYLKGCRDLCDQYKVLLIADEIATGFGRTGKLFACEWAEISPDILCLGKALTGGYMTLAATLCTDHIAETISNGEASCFMHGPTFMGNPLACATANASLTLLEKEDWQQKVTTIEKQLQQLFKPLAQHSRVEDVRVLGAIGVVEAKVAVNMAEIQKRFVELGVWIRPFGKLIYVMPPYISTPDDLAKLANAISTVLDEDACFQS